MTAVRSETGNLPMATGSTERIMGAGSQRRGNRKKRNRAFMRPLYVRDAVKKLPT